MNQATVILAGILCVVTLMVPRKYILVPLIMAACLVPMNQRVILGGLDFTVLRILLLVSLIKYQLSDEKKSVAWNSFDKLFLAWVLVGSFVYIVRYEFSIDSIINRSGVFFDAVGMYWLFRHTIQSVDDIFIIIKSFAVFALISAPLVAAEKFRESSFYSIFGPVGAGFHRGRFRSAGPFSHYIMLGVFWASLLPLFYARIKAGIGNLFYWLAIIASLVCVYFSASSTPIGTTVAIIVFWNLYRYRIHGKKFLVLAIFLLSALHLVMDAPVWHLIARVDLFGGSTGWHRYHLLDQFIKHWQEWFLVGTISTSEWGYGLGDVTNQYVLEAVRGGAVTMVLFIVMFYRAVTISNRYSIVADEIHLKFVAWGVTVSILGHIVTFFGVSYFGQIDILLYFSLAIAGFFKEKTDEIGMTEEISTNRNNAIVQHRM